MSKNYKVLFVDDDPYSSQTYTDELQNIGLSVSQVQGVDEALRMVKRNSYELIILDVMMSHGNYFSEIETAGGYKTGIALAREIREYQSNALIVCLTNSNDPEVESWFTQDEYVAYFNKKEILPEKFAKKLSYALFNENPKPEIFIVHGRDDVTKNELKQFIEEEFDFGEPIILSERPSLGMTIIEKFEYYASKADIAFILMTPDDIGSLAITKSKKRHRTRQNVIFEFGYFLGSMKRLSGRTILLYKGDIEIPSDISGMVYIDISYGIKSAREEIKRELKANLW